MTTYDLQDASAFAEDIRNRMDRCENGEGTVCSDLDSLLLYYAKLCCEFREGVRSWGREVFAGRVPFDEKLETYFRESGADLLHRASEMLDYGRNAETPCYAFDGTNALHSAISDLRELFEDWISPQLAVGPSARLGFPVSIENAERVRETMESLPPLPPDWQPEDPRLRKLLPKIRKRQ